MLPPTLIPGAWAPVQAEGADGPLSSLWPCRRKTDIRPSVLLQLPEKGLGALLPSAG